MAKQTANISPLDGRYRKDVLDLALFFSEEALVKYRIRVEIEYLIALSKEKRIPEIPMLSSQKQNRLRKLYERFSTADAERVKAIEATTNHDVKAVEYFLREKLVHTQHKNLIPWIHFALTSEDVNNLAYSLMWKDALVFVYLPTLKKVYRALRQLARKYKSLAVLSLTHGQPASPTTLGKEYAVFCQRLLRQLNYLKAHTLQGKLNGATGTWGAHHISYPDIDWIRFSRRFIKSLGLEPNLITTQIEPHDSLAESYHALVRVNSVLTDLCRDLWMYISRGILGQKKVAGEIGSSTMPHKINPIFFENAEGNFGVSNALFNHLATKLPISRMQRDLSDSTVIRNQGVALGHALLGLKNLLKGLGRLTVNRSRIHEELHNHWETLAEAVQTVLRKSGREDAYEQLKSLTRGQEVTREQLHDFIAGLDISDEDRKLLLSLSPETYIGMAAKLIETL